MKNDLVNKIAAAGQKANQALRAMPAKEKTKLEDAWDVEHAYYSSALEGSKIDKKEFEKIAKQTK